MNKMVGSVNLTQQALALKTTLAALGFKVGMIQIREILAEYHGFTSWDLLIAATAKKDAYGDDLYVIFKSAIQMLSDYAFPHQPGTPSNCTMRAETGTNKFYGIEIVSPCRNEVVRINIDNHTREAIGHLFGFEILKALLPDNHSIPDSLI